MKTNANTDRRKMLVGITGIAAGLSQAPSKWTRPVVDVVLLPAHAQTSTTTMAPTTAAPVQTTPAPCATPVLDTSHITVSNELVMRDPSGLTSGGTATTQITNSSTVAISLSTMLSVVPPVQGVNISITAPSQLQPGQSDTISIGTMDNLCQVMSTLTLQITATSLDPVCQGNAVINLNVGYLPNC